MFERFDTVNVAEKICKDGTINGKEVGKFAAALALGQLGSYALGIAMNAAPAPVKAVSKIGFMIGKNVLVYTAAGLCAAQSYELIDEIDEAVSSVKVALQTEVRE